MKVLPVCNNEVLSPALDIPSNASAKGFLESSDLNQKQKDILKNFEPAESNEYYAWWNYFEGYSEDWNTSAEPWKAIQNGSLVESIEAKRRMLEKVVDQLENVSY